ncbi:MAG TPA: pseudouridine synthase [Vicinamibacterales bacterium]|nr:pseudouridine synthase [Vicinamibacterales bacterium]
MNDSPGIRLQKILSQAGVASRRASERLIEEGRVSVNGRTVREMGVKADPQADDIRVDGRRLRAPERHRYILLNKPAGVVTTRSDPQRRQTVLDLLGGVREYVYPVGRLDYDSEGLLLLTNDGDLAARLTHPRHEVERTYEAYVAGTPDEEAIGRLRRGIPLDGKRTMPADVKLLSRAISQKTAPHKGVPYEGEKGARDERGKEASHHKRANGVLLITIREGRNRQVRRMCEAVGHPVRKLRRVRIGPITDRRLRVGEWRELTRNEVEKLKTGKVEK